MTWNLIFYIILYIFRFYNCKYCWFQIKLWEFKTSQVGEFNIVHKQIGMMGKAVGPDVRKTHTSQNILECKSKILRLWVFDLCLTVHE